LVGEYLVSEVTLRAIDIDVVIVANLVQVGEVSRSREAKLPKVYIVTLSSLVDRGFITTSFRIALYNFSSVILPKRHPRRKDQGKRKGCCDLEKLSHGYRGDRVQENEVA
jgi:hypothetical protein